MFPECQPSLDRDQMRHPGFGAAQRLGDRREPDARLAGVRPDELKRPSGQIAQRLRRRTCPPAAGPPSVRRRARGLRLSVGRSVGRSGFRVVSIVHPRLRCRHWPQLSGPPKAWPSLGVTLARMHGSSIRACERRRTAGGAPGLSGVQRPANLCRSVMWITFLSWAASAGF
jgi:hypothetical protein